MKEDLSRLQTAFSASLGKLSEESTKEVGMKELQATIDAHCTPQALRVYLRLISTGAKPPAAAVQGVNTCGKELCVLLLGCIAKKYKRNMIDPIDNPASLEKTIARVCRIAHSYLNVPLKPEA